MRSLSDTVFRHEWAGERNQLCAYPAESNLMHFSDGNRHSRYSIIAGCVYVYFFLVDPPSFLNYLIERLLNAWFAHVAFNCWDNFYFQNARERKTRENMKMDGVRKTKRILEIEESMNKHINTDQTKTTYFSFFDSMSVF